jgi:hypothetical protein
MHGIRILLLATVLGLASCLNAEEEAAVEKRAAAAEADVKQEWTELKERSEATAAKAGDAVEQGYANISAESREEYPKVVAATERQLRALNSWAVEEYRETFHPEAPFRDQLIEDFKDQIGSKPMYTIESFLVTYAAGNEAKARITLTFQNENQPPGLKVERGTYVYTFRKEAEGDDWLIYDVNMIELNGKPVNSNKYPPRKPEL